MIIETGFATMTTSASEKDVPRKGVVTELCAVYSTVSIQLVRTWRAETFLPTTLKNFV
jgi:hypothetical protein